MKKVLFLMLMFMGLMSSLYALDTIKVGCDVEKSQSISGASCIAYEPSDVTFVKVNILHKDTLMYSWGEGIDTKITKWTEGQNANINLASITLAVVCYPRGESGV